MKPLTDAISQIDRWLQLISKRRQRADAAVRAVLLALNETKAYITDWNAGTRSRERELALIRLWTDAAVVVRRKDREFAQRLQLKAEYWTDPERWTQVDVERAGIQIERVAGMARSLLGGAM